MGLSGAYKKFAFSASASYKETETTITEKEKFISDVAAYQWTTNIDINPVLGMQAQNFIDRISVSFEEDPKPYERFIEMFGTHYFQKGIFGGCINSVGY